MIKPVVITLHTCDYLDKAFRILPSNAIIYKGRCGIGGTTLEILAKRCSIIIVPTKGAIHGKCRDHHRLFAVDGDVSVEQVEAELTSKKRYKKLMVTPNSVWKIIQAASNQKMLDKLYSDYFLLFDEFHAIVTEAFRERILLPLNYLWEFQAKTLISATPFDLSDERFHQLTPYHIKFREPYLNEVLVRIAPNVEACLDHYIQNRKLYPGPLLIWYNSVKEAAEAMRRNGIEKVSHIYCADKSENFEKMPENLLVFQQQPTDGQYAEVNFFTSKYFECIDINEPNATVILVSDIHKPHTKVGIVNKGVQAVGRVRSKPHQIIHITNHRNQATMKTIEQFKREYEIHSQLLISHYNDYRKEQIEPVDTTSTVKDFADIDQKTKLATLNKTKRDQIINELICNEAYNTTKGITDAWEKALHKTTVQYFDSSAATKKYRSKADKLKEDVELIDEIMAYPERHLGGETVNIHLQRIYERNPLACEAHSVLGKAGMEELKYNEKAIREAVIERHNEMAENRLLLYLDIKLNVGDRKTPEELTSILQYGYNLFRIRNPKTGKVKVAHATQLHSSGWYHLKESKDLIGGKQQKVFIITHQYFRVQGEASAA